MSKKLLLIPFTILAIAVVIILMNYVQTGSFIDKGISLSGGTSFTVLTEQDISVNYEGEVVMRHTGESTIVEVATTDSQEIDRLKTELQQYGEVNVETLGSSLGESFFKQTIIAMIVAFILMGIVVYLYFKKWVPCLAVILAAVSDIIITIAILDIMNIKLSSAGVAALLMLIGYSVDTDILLSSKVLLKKEGTLNQRIKEAFTTGMMMTGTTIVAVTIALIFTQSQVIQQIMLIVLIGLVVDLMNTWIQNVGILRWYVEG